MTVNTSRIWKGCIVLDLIIILIAGLAFSRVGLSVLVYGARMLLSFTPYPLLSLAIIIGIQLIDIWIKILIAKLYDKRFLRPSPLPPYVSLQGIIVSATVMNIITYFIISYFFITLDISLGQFILSTIQALAYISICWLCGFLLNKATASLFTKTEKTQKRV